jgi:replicative DNA helicase
MPGGRVQNTASVGRNGVLDAEGAFTGALLHMAVATAKEALDLVQDDDLADFLNQKIVSVARLLAAEGVAPDPVAILTRARADGIVAGNEATRALGARLGELYGAVPTPASWRFYGHGVIDDALRRQCIAMGNRVLQAAESCALDVLIDVLDAECRVVRRLHNRRLATTPKQLRAVAG